MGDQTLHLEVANFQDRNHWRWVLKDPGGAFLADHEVSLDPADARYGAIADLHQYLQDHAAPDTWLRDQVSLVEKVGAWLGEQLLGPIASEILKAGTPAVVRVVVPPDAENLLYLPLELAHAGGKPLALQDLSLVFDVEGEAAAVAHRPIGDRLRMLAVFSLPTTTSALALRRERYALSRLIEEISQTHQAEISLRVLQYGVTRTLLAEVIEEEDGAWDVMHFSGHGFEAGLVLEKDDGTEDVVPGDELVGLLRPARGSLKLITLSSCLSAAATLAETRQRLGIGPSKEAAQPTSDSTAVVPGLARALVGELDCAVVAMRFPVGDDFAISLSAELYERVLGRGQGVARALQLALPAALRGGPSGPIPPLSVATPALFGRQAADLRLKAPPLIDRPLNLRLAGFPDEPKRFVGRVLPMGRASMALAPRSERRGVLFHGMAGAGKTACTLELAYRYRDLSRFRHLVFHKAPNQGADIARALADLAVDFERQTNGLVQMIHLIDQADEFAAWLPQLSELLENVSILVVLDNLESLLTPEGEWRDQRWERLVAALVAHSGFSRVVLTSRVLPRELDSDRVLVEPVNALSLDEAVLLARELPHLGALLMDDGPAGQPKGRELLSRTIQVVQGHPKLIELADGLAKDPQALEAQLQRSVADWSGDEQRLRTFFEAGTTPFGAEEFLDQLSSWTVGSMATLSPQSRTLFQYLCCLEESDRQSGILWPTWPEAWRRMGLDGEPPELEATLAPVIQIALVDPQALGEDRVRYAIHPGVADVVATPVPEVQRAVDEELATFWLNEFQVAREGEAEGGGTLVVQAGLSATPYLLRLGALEAAMVLLEQVLSRAPSPDTIGAVLPILRAITEARRDTAAAISDAGVLAKALYGAGRVDEAETMMRDLLRRSEQEGDYRTASAMAGSLITLLRSRSRLVEALALTDRLKEFTKRANLGPWSRLSDEGARLQLLAAMGHYDEVLAAVKELRPKMRELPQQGPEEERVIWWNVQEVILDSGRAAADGLQAWDEELQLIAEIAKITERRGAPILEVAKTTFNAYGPLLRLRRYDAARQLLEGCRVVFEQERYLQGLGRLFSALADLEDELSHEDEAIGFERAALRYKYGVQDPDSCSVSHLNMGYYLRKVQPDSSAAVAHRLAASLIDLQSGSGSWLHSRRVLRAHLVAFAPKAAPVPSSFDELCRIVEEVPGVHFRDLFARLAGPFATGDEALAEVVRLAMQEEPETGGA